MFVEVVHKRIVDKVNFAVSSYDTDAVPGSPDWPRLDWGWESGRHKFRMHSAIENGSWLSFQNQTIRRNLKIFNLLSIQGLVIDFGEEF